MTNTQELTQPDLLFLDCCLELAREALDAGDEPFGSVLVSDSGEVLFADRNRVAGGDHTQHPEFAIARWAVTHLTPEARAAATVYTSGEHCPMCSAAHAWVGLGRIVYASSSAQLAGWLEAWGVDAAPVAALPIHVVAPGIEVTGPSAVHSEQVRQLHAQMRGKRVD